MRKFDISEAILKGVSVSGIALVWFNFTLKALKFAWHIISTSPDEYTLNVVSTAVCEECEERFLDDGNEPENGRFLCENCKKQQMKAEKRLFQ